MIERLVISGFGGQGVMFVGRLIAWAAMRENKFVTFLPAYGAEVRGGTSHCSIIISDREIFSPCVDEMDTLIALNAPSLTKFAPKVRSGGDIFINSSMADKDPNLKGANLHYIPFTALALKKGNVRIANIIALGAYLAKKKALSAQKIFKMLPEAFPNNPGLLRLNEQAFKEGLRNGKG